MIDFRYHLVSLISVFLALAVGIALGAGPLKEAIGDSLTGQVDQLREEKEALRDELDDRTGELGVAEAAMAALAPDVLDGVLAGRRVVIVAIADVEPVVLEQVVGRLGEAGATVTGTVQVTPAWTDPEQRTFRQTLAGTLLDYLDPVPAEDVGTGTELAEALAQALTSAMPTDPDALSENAGLLLELLAEGGLISMDAAVDAPADAVVVLVGPTASLEDLREATQVTESQQPAEAAADEELRRARVESALEIGAAVQTRSSGALVAGGELAGSELLSAVRDDEDLATRLSTVESVHGLPGQVAVPLALAARISGTVGHYGPSAGATDAMPPRVVLPTIERIPAEPPAAADPGASAGEGTDPGGAAPPGPDGATDDGADQG